MDFTLKIYKKLLKTFLDRGYRFITFEEYCELDKEGGETSLEKFVILRHDVDEYAWNAFEMAKVEYSLGIRATYYFRMVRQSNVPDVIEQITSWGHEIGYHYEVLSNCNGNLDKAISEFEENLNYLRSYYPVRTVCMHGSSTSKYDNRELWKNYNLDDFGLIGEPYLSVDFEKIFYLTDTGYAWDGGKYAVRDVVENKFNITFHSTSEIVESIKKCSYPNKSMILAHTLWTDKHGLWLWLFIREKLRNNIKLMTKRSRLIRFIYSGFVKLYWKIK